MGFGRVHMGLYRRLVKGRRFPLHKGNGPGGAGGQAVAQAVAVIVPKQFGLSVHHADGSFLTRAGTGAASVAFILINVNDLANHTINRLS